MTSFRRRDINFEEGISLIGEMDMCGRFDYCDRIFQKELLFIGVLGYVGVESDGSKREWLSMLGVAGKLLLM